VEITAGPDDVDFSAYPIHVLASTFKCFLREMPEPLLRYDLYDRFLRAAATTTADGGARARAVRDVAARLPAPNRSLLDRLAYHLARVAHHADANRMPAGNLAVVFAPCVLRPPAHRPAQESLQDVGKQTACLEAIIDEQLRAYERTLDEFITLESATAATQVKLTNLRSSRMLTDEGTFSLEDVGEIENLEANRSLLEETLAALEPRLRAISSEDEIACPYNDSRRVSRDTDDDTDDNYSVTFDLS
ncbi:PREDICTED: unconventional myosin-IXa-like, partial [Priapulus caudatus]|uniref:Unconventional myosin-IXa-like n=1 Tax=Priapulus caudatus TaxID=37621 RepID=A0ABM1F5S0_PRICU